MSTNSKKRNKRNRRRAILIAFLLMLLVGVVLGTGTYAWFTANKTVTVDDITVNVATSNGLQISADAITFKTLLSNDIFHEDHRYHCPCLPGEKTEAQRGR